MKAFAILIVTLAIILPIQATPVMKNQFISVSPKGDVLILSSLSGAQKVTLDLPGDAETVKEASIKDPLWGRGQQLSVKHADCMTTVTLYEGNPFVYLETQITNTGEQVRDITKRTITEMEIDLAVAPETLVNLGSGGRYASNELKNSYAYSVLADPESRQGVVCGWLTQQRGVGVMLPSFQNGVHALESQLDFGLLRIQPGQTRSTDILVVGFFDDARIGLEQYADHVAKVYDINLPPKPNVYCTWYHRDQTGSGASTEKMMAENASFAQENLAAFGLDVFQIDDEWQALENDPGTHNNGPYKTFISTTEHFPSGMTKMAETLEKEGFTPGIWFMPFAGDTNNPTFNPEVFATDKSTGLPFEERRWSGATIDASSPAGEAFLRERFQRIYKWGYRYIKVDGLHVGTPSPNLYVNRTYEGKVFADAEIHDKNMTFIESYRKGLDILREEFPDTFILGCAAPQNYLSLAPVFGKVDAMRVGPDNGGSLKGEWDQIMAGADFAGNFWFLNNRVWYNDPDPIYVRESVALHHARWMASWLAVSGAMHTSSTQYGLLPAERLDIIKRTLPSHSLDARPVDILEHKHPQIWKVANERLCVIGLFNWKEKESLDITYSLKRMGLDASKSYDVFDFWGDTYLGTIQGELKSLLEGGHCKVLALREVVPYPQVLSTSRHITQGLMDVVSEAWDSEKKTLSGVSHVIAGDPYELRITCPVEFKVKKVNVANAKVQIGDADQESGVIRVVLTPTKTNEALEWNIIF